MSVLFLVFTPVTPPFTELAAAFRDVVGVRAALGELCDHLSICEPGVATEGREAGAPACLRLVLGLQDSNAETRRLAKHWPSGLAPEEVAVLRLEYTRTSVGLVRRVMTELASRFRFFVETADGRLHSAEGFARRCAREPGAWWDANRARLDAPAAFAADVLARVTDPDGGGVAGAPVATGQVESTDELLSSSGFAAWRPLGDWLPPGTVGDGHLAVLAVASLASGPALELSGRVVPGLIGWFARRLRAWEGELRSREPDLLRRPAAYLFVAARAVGSDELQGSERVAWYPGIVESVHGYGDASHGPGDWVDLRLGELLERGARMLETG